MKINDILYDKYYIKNILGKGGMGIVYLAENIKLGNLWAVKEINKSKEEKIDLLAEPNMLKNLNHPSLPRIFDIFEDEDNMYIVLDYVEGKSLDKELNIKGEFSEGTVIDWAKQICDALIYLHENKPNPIIYRDMKPSNLMINVDNKVKIIDFGIAREHKKEAESDTTYMGTRGYAAPEQYGTTQTDQRTDIYSLGITLYHLITGKSPNEPPFEIVPVRQLNSNLSVGIEHIINKCIQLDPKKRYQDCREILRDLNNIHKFSNQYKSYRIRNFTKLIVFCIAIVGFSFLINSGIDELKLEKENKYIELMNEGISLSNGKYYEESIERYKQAIQLYPTRVEPYLQIAQIYFSMKEYIICIEYIENNTFTENEEYRNDDRFLYMVGTCYFELEEYETARVYLEKSIGLAPLNETYRRDLAICYAKTGQIENAEKHFNDMKKQGIREDISWYVDGEISYAAKKIERALESFDKSIETSEDQDIKRRSFVSSAQILKENLTTINNGMNRLVNILEKANIELESKNDIQIIEMTGEAYYMAASTQEDKKIHLIKPIDQFKKLLELGYKRPYIYLNLAGIYSQIGELGESEKYLLEMKSNYLDNYTCYRELAMLYAEMENKKPNEGRDYSRTVENYNLAIKHSPNGESTQDLLPLVNLMNDLKKGNWIK